jgi:hypothetical protein
LHQSGRIILSVHCMLSSLAGVRHVEVPE